MNRKCLILFFLCVLFLSGCRKPDESVQIDWVLKQENAVILSDGTSVDIWSREPFTQWDYYRLKDGTGLLTVEETVSPLYVSVGYMTLQDLPEEAQEAICDYYEDQGLLYDIPATLEKACAEYRSSKETGAVFTGYRLYQQSSPCSFGEQVVCFVTVLEEPLRGNLGTTTQLCACFDRETGAPVSIWDLFTVPEDDVRQRLVSAFAEDDQTSAQMAAALKPEYIALEEDCLSIFFPAGSLPDQEYATGTAIDYTEIRDIMFDWAIPEDLTP